MNEQNKRNVSLKGIDIEAINTRFNFRPNNNRTAFRVSDNIRASKVVAKELFDALDKLKEFDTDKKNKEFLTAINNAATRSMDQSGRMNMQIFSVEESRIIDEYPEIAKEREKLVDIVDPLQEQEYELEVSVIDHLQVKTIPNTAIAQLAWMLPEELYISDLPKNLDLQSIKAIEKFCKIIMEDRPASKMTVKKGAKK